MTQTAASSTAAHQERVRPLDARLARRLVRPLAGTVVTPNYLTTLRLVLGLTAAGLLAAGDFAMANAGAFVFALSNFVDHTDGELARLSGAFSRLGHWYDLACDLLIHVLLFVALGYGLSAGRFGPWAEVLGLIVGLAVAFIFGLHAVMETRIGQDKARLPALELFEIEDMLYLFPLVTLCNVRTSFLAAAAVGAPLFALWLVGYFRRAALIEAD